MAWRWREGVLVDSADAACATASSDLLRFRDVRLTIASTMPALVRAGDYSLRKQGLTVQVYAASCAGRQYLVRRTGFGPSKRREILSASGAVVATTRAVAGGRELELRCNELNLDVVFISWALTWIDLPVRRTYY